MRAAQGVCSAYGDSSSALCIPISLCSCDMDSDAEASQSLEVRASEEDDEDLQLAKALSLSAEGGGGAFEAAVIRGNPDLNGYPKNFSLQTIEPGVYFRTPTGPINDPKVSSR